MPLRKISSCVTTSGLIRHARYLMELQQVFLEAVPSSLKAGASVGYVRQGALVLLAHNGGVAAKLKQMAPSLLTAYRERGFEVTKIHITVQVDRAP
jgi:hypothetical protein